MKTMVYGYARTSTFKQKIERQVENLKREYENIVVFEEQYTGTTIERPIFKKLIKNVKRGDTIVFDEVSRFTRNAEEGFKLYKELFEKGVNLVFLKEKHINTETFKKALDNQIANTDNDVVNAIIEGVNNALMILAKQQIELAFEKSQAEVDLLHKRTSEGVRRAMMNGKQVGRKQGATIETKKAKEMKKKIIEYSKDFKGILKDTDLIKMLGISRNSFYKYKRLVKDSMFTECSQNVHNLK